MPVFVFDMCAQPVNKLVRSRSVCRGESLWVGYKYGCSNCQQCQSSSWAAHTQDFAGLYFIGLLSIFNSRNHPLGVAVC